MHLLELVKRGVLIKCIINFVMRKFSFHSKRTSSDSRARARAYTVSESSEGLLHNGVSRLKLYGDMAQLHPPYVVEASSSAVKESVNNPKRYVLHG